MTYIFLFYFWFFVLRNNVNKLPNIILNKLYFLCIITFLLSHDKTGIKTNNNDHRSVMLCCTTIKPLCDFTNSGNCVAAI